MKTLNFVELKTTSKGVERKVIFTWHDVTKKSVGTICGNFLAGFVYAHSSDLRVDMLAYACQQWRYHDSIGYKRWQFENGRQQIVKR